MYAQTQFTHTEVSTYTRCPNINTPSAKHSRQTNTRNTKKTYPITVLLLLNDDLMYKSNSKRCVAAPECSLADDLFHFYIVFNGLYPNEISHIKRTHGTRTHIDRNKVNSVKE